MSLPLCGIFPINSPRSSQAALEYPLVKATCNCNVVDVYILTELVQEYASKAKEECQITYAFPLPPSAAVCNFKAVIDDKKIINGVVKAKEEAKKMYDNAIARGKQAGLLVKDHVDLFTVSLGNIKPSQRVVVHISYVSMISHDGGSSDSLRLTIPVTIASRYGAPPTSLPGQNPLNVFKLDVSLQMNAPITMINSPTHPIKMDLGSLSSTSEGAAHDANLATVSFQDSVFLEKDIVIIISAQKLDHPRCVAEKWLASDGTEETTHAYALTMVPKFDLPPVKSQEYIFLVDRSGSMGGQRIESVKVALQIMLRSLPSRNTTFNIISFGSHTSSLWPKSESYNAASVNHASTHVETIDADYGGTELASALNVAYDNKTRSHPEVEPSTVVFILTDGDSWDLRGVVDQVTLSTKSAKESGHLLRTFVLGVGDGVAVGMCENIARAGQGTAVFVGYNEKPEAKLVGLLRAARGGVVDNVTMDWGLTGGSTTDDEQFEMVESDDKIEAEVANTQQIAINLFDSTSEPVKDPETGPKEVVLPPTPKIQQAPKPSALSFPIYPGFRSNIFAIIKQNQALAPFSSTIKIRGDVLGVPVTLDVAVQSGPTCGTEAHLLHTLAARALVEGLEDESTSPTAKAEITRLGIRYNLATSATSFVAIEEDSSEMIVVDEKAPLVTQSESKQESDDEMGFAIFDDGVDEVLEEGGMAEVAVRSQTIALGFGCEGEDSETDQGFSLSFDQPIAPALSIAPAPLMPSIGAIAAGPGAPRPGGVVPAPKRSVFSSMRSFVTKKSSPPAPAPTSATSYPMSVTTVPLSSTLAPAPARSLSPTPSSAPVNAPSSAPEPVMSPSLTLGTLAQAQGFDGAFMNKPSTVSLLLNGQGLPAIPRVLDEASLGVDDKANVWVTILALAVMQAKFGTDEERAAWSLLAEKATDFVCGMLVEAGLTEQAADKLLKDCKEEAMKFV